MDRNELRSQGQSMRQRLLPEAQPSPTDQATGFADFASEAVFGAIWNRPGLDLESRMICTLCALTCVQRLPQVRHFTTAALTIGIRPRTILEVLIHCGLYAGFPTSENSIEVAQQVFGERRVTIDPDAAQDASLEELTRRGADLLHRLHGDRGTQGYASPDNPTTGTLYPIAIQYGYGELWFRPGLDHRQRALCAVASFTASRMEGQLRKFGQSALNVGLDRQEVIEAVIQTAPYSGFPGALNALAALSDVL